MTPEQRAARRATDLLAAVETLTLAGSVGLALRDHRRRLGLSQRAYAAVRAWSASRAARLESDAGRFSLDDVIEALEGTSFGLALVALPPDGSSPAHVVDAGTWRESELIARVRDGSRRFPAHHEVEAVDNPPRWWWHREFFVHGFRNEPEWYARRPPPGWAQHLMGIVPPEGEQANEAEVAPAVMGRTSRAARSTFARGLDEDPDERATGSRLRPVDDAAA